MHRTPPAIAFADPTCMVFTWRSLVVPVLGRPAPTVDATRAQAKAIQDFGASLGPRAMHEISILDDEFPMPSAEVRAAMEAASPLISPYYASVSCVYGGAGFRAAFVRGVLATLQLVGRADFPQKVFATTDECARWTASQAVGSRGSALDPLEIAAVIADARRIATERGVLGERAPIVTA